MRIMQTMWKTSCDLHHPELQWFPLMFIAFKPSCKQMLPRLVH